MRRGSVRRRGIQWAVLWAGKFLISAAALAVAVAGCGSETSSEGSAPTESCNRLCDKILSLGCPNDTRAQCLADCAKVPRPAGCSAQVAAYLGCFQTRIEFVCGADGMVTPPTSDQVTAVCANEGAAYVGCAICEPSSSDDDCDTCGKATCCAQWKAYASDPNTSAFADCVLACSDGSCVASCNGRFPSVAAKLDAVFECRSANCPTC